MQRKALLIEPLKGKYISQGMKTLHAALYCISGFNIFRSSRVGLPSTFSPTILSGGRFNHVQAYLVLSFGGFAFCKRSQQAVLCTSNESLRSPRPVRDEAFFRSWSECFLRRLCSFLPSSLDIAANAAPAASARLCQCDRFFAGPESASSFSSCCPTDAYGERHCLLYDKIGGLFASTLDTSLCACTGVAEFSRAAVDIGGR